MQHSCQGGAEMKAIKILVLFLSVSSFLLGAKTDIYFANGITTLEADAQASAELLRIEILEYVYNGNIGKNNAHIRKVTYA